MRTITMKEAVCDFPNMMTVLRCFAPLLKNNVSKVLMTRDLSDAACIYVDSCVSGEQLHEFYNQNVPDSIACREIGSTSILPIKYAGTSDMFTDITDIAEEVWSEVKE